MAHNPYKPLQNPSFHFMFHFLCHLILHYWGYIPCLRSLDYGSHAGLRCIFPIRWIETELPLGDLAVRVYGLILGLGLQAFGEFSLNLDSEP